MARCEVSKKENKSSIPIRITGIVESILREMQRKGLGEHIQAARSLLEFQSEK